MTKTTTAGLLAGVIALAGCRGEELARVSVTAVGAQAEATWTSDGSEAVLWADYAGEWTGSGDDPGLSFEVELLEGGASIAKQECQTGTCSSRICSSTVTIGNQTKGSCECKMDCRLAPPKAGTYVVRATARDHGGHLKSAKNLALVLRK